MKNNNSCFELDFTIQELAREILESIPSLTLTEIEERIQPISKIVSRRLKKISTTYSDDSWQDSCNKRLSEDFVAEKLFKNLTEMLWENPESFSQISEEPHEDLAGITYRCSMYVLRPGVGKSRPLKNLEDISSDLPLPNPFPYEVGGM